MSERATTHKSSDNVGRCEDCLRLRFMDTLEWYCETTNLGEPLYFPTLRCLEREACEMETVYVAKNYGAPMMLIDLRRSLEPPF